MKVLTVLGARPQFVKAATVSRKLKETGVSEIILHTGQHYDANMSEVFFREMDIPAPDYNLGIADLQHGAMTGRMLEKIEEIMLVTKPDVVLVYGDTNSTLAGALAASKLHIPVAHVEAGLRSFDMKMPEEINRVLTDRVSKLLFCPTAASVRNLQNEGYGKLDVEIIQSGDVMYDSVLYFREKIAANPAVIQREGLHGKEFILATLHRAENTNDPGRLFQICEALNEINATYPVVIPLHPRTKAYLASNKIKLTARTTDPLGYFDMLALLKHCKMVLTDSGGLQKESYFFNKFCITLRDRTEWVELVEAGANALAGASKEKILALFRQYVNYTPGHTDLYGDGHAAVKVATRLLDFIQR